MSQNVTKCKDNSSFFLENPQKLSLREILKPFIHFNRSKNVGGVDL